MRSILLVTSALVLAGLSLTPNSVRAQTDADAALAVVVQFFDGMRAKDTTAISATLNEHARLVSTQTSGDGTPQISSTPIDGFLNSIANAPVSLDEPIWDPVIQVSDRLATVWVKYAFYANEEFSHCGVDAFQLFKSDEGWKIFQITDTRRRADCWEPPA